MMQATRSIRLLGAIIAVLVLGKASVAVAAMRYVAPDGSDSGNNCLDSSEPCASVNRAIGQVQDGDVIQVAPGVYSGGLVEGGGCVGSGSTPVFLENKDCPGGCTITAQIVADPPNVTLQGGDLAICAADSTGWTIRGIGFTAEMGPQAFRSDLLTVEDVRFDFTDQGAAVPLYLRQSDGVTLRRIVMDNSTWGSNGCAIYPDSKQIGVIREVDGLLIDQSYFGHDNSMLSIRESADVTIRRTTFEQFTEHGIVLRDDTSDVLIENSIFRADTSCDATTTQRVGPRIIDIYDVTGLVVRNNTVAGHGYMWQNWIKFYDLPEQCGFAGGGNDKCDLIDAKFYNNLVHDIIPLGGGSGSNDQFVVMKQTSENVCSNFHLDGNLYSDGPAEWRCPGESLKEGFDEWSGSDCCGASGNADPNGTGATPSFANYALQDYRPAGPGAAQVDAGVNGTDADGIAKCASEDFDGNPRTDGQCDIGAYELAGGSTPQTEERIECTETAFVAAIASACSGGSKLIQFDCQNTTILISESSDKDDRRITCDDVIIDGESRNIEFRLDPPCDQNFPDSCPDIEAGAWLVRIDGDGNVVRNIGVHSFWEGIHVSTGFGNRIENIDFTRPCDDAFTNRNGATGTLFTQNTIRNACDKAIQIYGRDIASTSDLTPEDPDYYDLRVVDNDFIDCKQPIKTSSDGRFLVQGNTFRVENPQGSLFSCDGPRFEGDGVAVYFADNMVQNCRRGLRIFDQAQVFVEGNTFLNNELRGAAVFGSARAVFQYNRFENNGGSTSGEAFYGGLVAAESAQLDAGGGTLTLDGVARSSAGQNVFLGNRSSSDSTLDLTNLTTQSVFARQNYWGDSDPSDQIDGVVDFAPWLDSEPGEPQDGEPNDGDPPLPPPTPTNLQREDVVE